MLSVLTHQVNANKNYFKVPSGSEWPLSGVQMTTHAGMGDVNGELFVVLSVEVQSIGNHSGGFLKPKQKS